MKPAQFEAGAEALRATDGLGIRIVTATMRGRQLAETFRDIQADFGVTRRGYSPAGRKPMFRMTDPASIKQHLVCPEGDPEIGGRANPRVARGHP